MHWAAEFGHLSTLKLLSEHFTIWTDADKVGEVRDTNGVELCVTIRVVFVSLQFGRNALHSAALGGNKECAFWLIRKSRDSSEFSSLTLVGI